jgi:hypothetical protein
MEVAAAAARGDDKMTAQSAAAAEASKVASAAKNGSAGGLPAALARRAASSDGVFENAEAMPDRTSEGVDNSMPTGRRWAKVVTAGGTEGGAGMGMDGGVKPCVRRAAARPARAWSYTPAAVREARETLRREAASATMGSTVEPRAAAIAASIVAWSPAGGDEAGGGAAAGGDG